MLAQQCGISVLLVALPRNRNSSTAPQHTTETTTQRSDIRKAPVRPLHIAHGTHVTAQELRYIRQISGGTGEDRDIPTPSQALIALRTVRRNGEEIAVRRPGDILPQLVHPGIGSFVVRSQFVYRA